MAIVDHIGLFNEKHLEQHLTRLFLPINITE